MIQTMESKPDSRAVAARVAMDQLEAMDAGCFDIRVKRVDGTMILREGDDIKAALKFAAEAVNNTDFIPLHRVGGQ
jgi:hypothetical protein